MAVLRWFKEGLPLMRTETACRAKCFASHGFVSIMLTKPMSRVRGVPRARANQSRSTLGTKSPELAPRPKPRLQGVRPETEEPAYCAPGSCGDSPSRTSVCAVIHPTPSSRSRRRAQVLRVQCVRSAEAAVHGADPGDRVTPRVAAPRADSSCEDRPAASRHGATHRVRLRWPPVADGCWERLAIS